MNTEERIERRHDAMRRHFENPAHQGKQTARRALGHQVRIGKIIPPTACEHCSIACKPHGHHRDYSRPFDVIWLCPTCHGLEHRNTKTNCKQGHLLTPESTYPKKNGTRGCRQCRYDSVQRHYETKGKFERKAKRDAARIIRERIGD